MAESLAVARDRANGQTDVRDAADKFPEGFQNAYWFAVFNALSFQVVLSSPMVLYARSLGASATVLGIIAGMMPLLVIFQIPAAQHIARLGYRNFVYAGWGARVAFIFAMSLVPLTSSFLKPSARLALMLALLFGFNLSRGISSCAWLPWMSSLVPEASRGRYLARDAACVNLASLVSFILGAMCLGPAPRPWQFSVLFAFSALMGAASLDFLKRVPDVPVPEEPRRTTFQIPWLAMINHPPFKKILILSVIWAVAYGGLLTFTVAFLKTMLNLAESRILLINSIAFLGGLCSLWFLGSRLDSMGSKPVLALSFLIWLFILAGWVALAGRIIAPGLWFLLLLHYLMGLFAALVSMSFTRLAMVTIPVMGRNHFFAIYSVVSNVALGLTPVGWGLVIDALGATDTRWLGLSWNRYTCFFAAVLVAMTGALFFARFLEEPKAASMEALIRDILAKSPLKIAIRLWPRI